MEGILRRFRWLKSPQLFVGFAVLCLCSGAASNLMRSVYASPQPGPSTVKGAATTYVQPDCQVMPCMAFTFDDGPNPDITPRILDILKRENIKGTFFLVGQRVPGQEQLVQRMHAEGHEIGNHSWNHSDFTKLPPHLVDAQIEQTQRVIMAAGVPAPQVLRPPYGAVNDVVKSRSHMPIVRWDIDPQDWEYRDAGLIAQNLVAHARPGGIILLHDIYPSTLAALEQSIQQLKGQYQFVTASQLMHLEPGDQGQYFGRGH